VTPGWGKKTLLSRGKYKREGPGEKEGGLFRRKQHPSVLEGITREKSEGKGKTGALSKPKKREEKPEKNEGGGGKISAEETEKCWLTETGGGRKKVSFGEKCRAGNQRMAERKVRELTEKTKCLSLNCTKKRKGALGRGYRSFP